jgi:hypothetical protein
VDRLYPFHLPQVRKWERVKAEVSSLPFPGIASPIRGN